MDWTGVALVIIGPILAFFIAAALFCFYMALGYAMGWDKHV